MFKLWLFDTHTYSIILCRISPIKLRSFTGTSASSQISLWTQAFPSMPRVLLSRSPAQSYISICWFANFLPWNREANQFNCVFCNGTLLQKVDGISSFCKGPRTSKVWNSKDPKGRQLQIYYKLDRPPGMCFLVISYLGLYNLWTHNPFLAANFPRLFHWNVQLSNLHSMRLVQPNPKYQKV